MAYLAFDLIPAAYSLASLLAEIAPIPLDLPMTPTPFDDELKDKEIKVDKITSESNNFIVKIFRY